MAEVFREQAVKTIPPERSQHINWDELVSAFLAIWDKLRS
jgi:hypothetical protein